jgi:hypothetical protein
MFAMLLWYMYELIKKISSMLQYFSDTSIICVREEIIFIFLIKNIRYVCDIPRYVSKTYPAIKFYFFNTKMVKHVPDKF